MACKFFGVGGFLTSLARWQQSKALWELTGAVSSLCAQTLQHCYHWSGLPGVGADSLVWGWEPRELTGFDERWLEDETVSPPQSH